MNNIGIGVVTCGIRKLSENILKYNPTIFVDKSRRGAAYVKNELIKKFYDEGKEYVFLFDDDCYPVIDGWTERIISWAKENDVHYFAGLDFKGINVKSGKGDTLISNNPYIGGYFFLDRKVIETIGYYNENLIKYGWEDVTYSIRVGKLYPQYKIPVWINMYIHSKDMFGEESEPNITNDDKHKYIKINEFESRREASSEIFIGYDDIRILHP